MTLQQSLSKISFAHVQFFEFPQLLQNLDPRSCQIDVAFKTQLGYSTDSLNSRKSYQLIFS